jgi:hypothetical protein
MRQTAIEVLGSSLMNLRSDNHFDDLETHLFPHAVLINSLAGCSRHHPVSSRLGGGAGHEYLWSLFQEQSGHPINRNRLLSVYVRVPGS